MLVAIIASHLALLLLNIAMWSQLNRFLARTPRIETNSDLADFKAVVKLQMITTLVVFILTATPWILWMVGHFGFAAVSWFDLGLWVALPWLVNVFLVVAMAGPANDAKKLEAATSGLEEEVSRVVEAWRKKLFPDW